MMVKSPAALTYFPYRFGFDFGYMKRLIAGGDSDV
jgi:hypothetical protein